MNNSSMIKRSGEGGKALKFKRSGEKNIMLKVLDQIR